MKVLIEEQSGEGLEALIGQRVTFYCLNYIYTGKLVGVNTTCVKLVDAAIVYETGSHDTKTYANSQPMPNDLYIQVQAVESFSVFK